MFTPTTTALLEGLHDPQNQAAWREFDARFRSILVAFAKRLNLSTEDAADAAQETLLRVVKEYAAGKYDRSRGRLHSWIMGIAKHCICDLKTRQALRREYRGMSAVVNLPGDDHLSGIWAEECHRAILCQGMLKLREDSKLDPQTIRAFEMLVFDQRTPAQVAAAMNMTANDVYLAKHRCLKRLAPIVGELTEAYETA